MNDTKPMTEHQYEELLRYEDNEPHRFDKRPNANLIRRNALTLAPHAGVGHYVITEYGRLLIVAQRWHGDGVVVPEWLAMESIADLGLMPEEVQALIAHMRREAEVWELTAPHHPRPELCAAVSAFYQRRARKWERLNALNEQHLTEGGEDDDDDQA